MILFILALIFGFGSICFAYYSAFKVVPFFAAILIFVTLILLLGYRRRQKKFGWGGLVITLMIGAAIALTVYKRAFEERYFVDVLRQDPARFLSIIEDFKQRAKSDDEHIERSLSEAFLEKEK